MLLVLTQGRRAAWHHQIRATKPVLPSTTFFFGNKDLDLAVFVSVACSHFECDFGKSKREWVGY
jgi:hypothetical protein